MTRRMTGESRRDIHQQITHDIVAAIERGAPEFKMPWHRSRGGLMHPVNATTGKRYQGINIISLWLAGEQRGFDAPLWATYKQWLAVGAQVRKGEKSSLIVFYKELNFERTDEATGETEDAKSLFARASHVFNAAQVDGFTPPPALDAPAPTLIESIARAEALLAASAANVREAGERAFYRPSDDSVHVPERSRFTGTDTISAQEAFYATLLHELTHWTGAPHRLARDYGKRFGDAAYAFEELVAELGASYLCADLGVTTTLRPDHAAYIASWLKVLKGDNRAIFTAASAAQRAANYLLQLMPEPHRPALLPVASPDLVPD